MNNYEAERQEARPEVSFNQNAETSALESLDTSGFVEDNSTLKEYLKNYQQNKLNKDNIWSSSIIDVLKRLVLSHHKTINNFKVAGSSLEASSKIYGLRVDDVHKSTLQVVSALSRREITEEDDNQSIDDVTADINNNDPQRMSLNNQVDTQKGVQSNKPKKKVRKMISTVTRNKETINGRLDTVPLIEPIFAVINSVPENVNSSNKLLTNTLPSKDSALILKADKKFWDSTDRDAIVYSEEDDYTEYETVDGKAALNVIYNGSVLRPTNTGYKLSDSPELEGEEQSVYKEIEEQTNFGIPFAFDINADVERLPENTQVHLDIDFGELGALTADEHIAINNCRGLRHSTIMIENLGPVNSSSSNLEYSYRPIDRITQFWAGPSYWKFHKSLGEHMNEIKNIPHQRRRRQLNKFQNQPVDFRKTGDTNLFQQIKRIKTWKTVNQKKWDSKKLKLPPDFQFDRNIFDEFVYAPGKQIHGEIEEGSSYGPAISIDQDQDENEDQNEDQNENQSQDQNQDQNPSFYLSAADVNVFSELRDEDDLPNQTVVEINSSFFGAPDKVKKVIVPFARRAKLVNMKRLKKTCKEIIDQQITETQMEENEPKVSEEFQIEKYKNGRANFEKVFESLKYQQVNQNDDVSLPLVFYSILHVANENNLRLVRDDSNDLNDFKILQIDSINSNNNNVNMDHVSNNDNSSEIDNNNNNINIVDDNFSDINNNNNNNKNNKNNNNCVKDDEDNVNVGAGPSWMY